MMSLPSAPSKAGGLVIPHLLMLARQAWHQMPVFVLYSRCGNSGTPVFTDGREIGRLERPMNVFLGITRRPYSQHWPRCAQIVGAWVAAPDFRAEASPATD